MEVRVIGHWYSRKGEPVFTVTNKSGDPKPTTLREARKLDLLPSVTTIIKEADSGPMLKRWITNQALLSALNHPGGVPSFARGGSPVEENAIGVREFMDWCRADSEKKVRDKAELGNSIHDALRQSFTDPDQVPAHFIAHVNGVRALLASEFGEDVVWEPERTHASELGFGGTIDLETDEVIVPGFPDGVLIDFKCKEFDEDKPVESMVWDEHEMQLGGYAELRKKKRPRCANVFVSTSVPGLAKIAYHEPDAIERGRAMFLSLNAFWRAKTRYAP